MDQKTKDRTPHSEEHLPEETQVKLMELELRKAELALQREQFEDLKRRKGYWAQITSPLGIAIVAGVLSLMGTAASGLINVGLESKKQRATESLESQKLTGNLILENKRQETSLLLKISETQDEKQRALNLLFFEHGGYLKFDKNYLDFLRKLAGLEEGQSVPPPALNPSALVDVPKSLNQGLSAATNATLIRIIGTPGNCTNFCAPPTNPKLKALLVTENVGPFTATGIKPAIAALRRIFAEVKTKEPDLYQPRSWGMLCCRRKRGTGSFSAHSWGIAIDLVFGNGSNDVQRGKTQSGLMRLYPYFNKEKFFWLAEGNELGMHFEASEQLLKEWEQEKLLNP
jgi:hypothetical protein